MGDIEKHLHIFRDLEAGAATTGRALEGARELLNQVHYEGYVHRRQSNISLGSSHSSSAGTGLTRILIWEEGHLASHHIIP